MRSAQLNRKTCWFRSWLTHFSLGKGSLWFCLFSVVGGGIFWIKLDFIFQVPQQQKSLEKKILNPQTSSKESSETRVHRAVELEWLVCHVGIVPVILKQQQNPASFKNMHFSEHEFFRPHVLRSCWCFSFLACFLFFDYSSCVLEIVHHRELGKCLCIICKL